MLFKSNTISRIKNKERLPRLMFEERHINILNAGSLAIYIITHYNKKKLMVDLLIYVIKYNTPSKTIKQRNKTNDRNTKKIYFYFTIT